MPSRTEESDRLVFSMSASFAASLAISSRAASRSTAEADRVSAIVRISAFNRSMS